MSIEFTLMKTGVRFKAKIHAMCVKNLEPVIILELDRVIKHLV